MLIPNKTLCKKCTHYAVNTSGGGHSPWCKIRANEINWSAEGNWDDVYLDSEAFEVPAKCPYRLEHVLMGYSLQGLP